jgi:hypothetical protein
MWHWIKTGIFSIVGGFAVGFVIVLALRATGDCSIGAAAKAIMFGLPIGNVLGAGLHRKITLKTSLKENILGGFIGLILSSFSALSGLYAMDILGGYIGFAFTLFSSALGSVFGYAASSKILVLNEKQWRIKVNYV